MEKNNENYIGEDGLLYCKKCGEPIEAYFPNENLFGISKHHRQCACERKAYETEQKERLEREHRELVERNRSICFEEIRMKEWNFANSDESNVTMQKAQEYVSNWSEMKKSNMGYLFWGPVGTGKSYLAGCIANALLEQEVTVKMTNFNTIIDDMYALEDKTEYINALARYELLIIDDLGVERNTEYALGIVFSVIDRRCRSGKPLIVTTNLSLKSLKEEMNLEKQRIYDRILMMCIPLYVDGGNKRSKIVNLKLDKMKKVLEENPNMGGVAE